VVRGGIIQRITTLTGNRCNVLRFSMWMEG
jgi:hypothetical protein